MLSCSACGPRGQTPPAHKCFGASRSRSFMEPTHRATLELHVLASVKGLLRNRCCMISCSFVTRTTSRRRAAHSSVSSMLQKVWSFQKVSQGFTATSKLSFSAPSRDRFGNWAASCFWIQLTHRLDWPTYAPPLRKESWSSRRCCGCTCAYWSLSWPFPPILESFVLRAK